MTFPLIDTLAAITFTVLLPPFLIVVILVVLLASVGKTIGIRLKYIEILLYIFEFGKKRLAKKRRYLKSTSADLTDEEEVDKEVDNNKNESQNIFRKISTANAYHRKTHEFQLSDSFEYMARGMEAIVDDEVTKRFTAEELTSWNFLTRTNLDYEFISVRLTIFWVGGFMVRYFFLLPLRLCILSIGMGLLVVFTTIINVLPDNNFRKSLGYWAYLATFRLTARAISAVINFHNVDNRPKSDGICVANHTSPIDCAILSCDNVYAFVGQIHGGFLGIFQRALSRASDHIWFERGEVKDRFAVARRLKAHVEDPTKMPILIFPEGTCINNTSVMQFKKGTFEVGSIIYPVAIKYDPRFGDAFWNSSKYSMLNYLYMMMTSWAIVCDVWYLPPMIKRETESSIEFANRVKAEIAKQGGLVDLLWDGALKRSAPKKEFKEYFQREYSSSLKLVDQDTDDDSMTNSLNDRDDFETIEEKEKMFFNNLYSKSAEIKHHNNDNGVSKHNGFFDETEEVPPFRNHGNETEEVPRPRSRGNEEVKKRKYGYVNTNLNSINGIAELTNLSNDINNSDSNYINNLTTTFDNGNHIDKSNKITIKEVYNHHINEDESVREKNE